jgi:hypothetical protein
MCCGKLVAWMILRTLTAPSSSMSLRIAYSKSGENCKIVSLSSQTLMCKPRHLPLSTICTARQQA